MVDAIDDHRADLEALAAAELPCSRIAALLLELDADTE